MSISRTQITEFLRGSTLHIVEYGEAFDISLSKRAGTSHTVKSKSMREVIAAAKECVTNPSQTFKCCEDFAKFCKTGEIPQQEGQLRG